MSNHFSNMWLSDDGSVVVTAQREAATEDGSQVRSSVRVWNATTGEALSSPFERPGEAKFVSFSRDADGFILETEIHTGRGEYPSTHATELITVGSGESTRLQDEQYRVFGMLDAAFTPDQTKVLTVALGQVQSWDATTGQPASLPKRIGSGGSGGGREP